MMKWSVFLLCLVSIALSETPSVAPSAPTEAPALNKGTVVGSPPGSTGPMSPGYIKPFDEGFFESKPIDIKSAPPGFSPRGREYGADPDYNTEQREEWLRKCGPYKDQDAKLFRQCFQREKDKMRLELREKFDQVERRQGGSGKSIDDLIQPNKGSGGFD